MYGGDTLLLLLHPSRDASAVDQLNNKSAKTASDARRCLFGQPNNSVVTNSFIQEELNREREYMIRRWDYDPLNDRPVVPAKRYPWEPIRRPANEGGKAEKVGVAESVTGDKTSPRKQLKITDFWKKRKLELDTTSNQKNKQPRLHSAGAANTLEDEDLHTSSSPSSSKLPSSS